MTLNVYSSYLKLLHFINQHDQAITREISTDFFFIVHLKQSFPFFLSYQSTLVLKAISLHTQGNHFPKGWLSVNDTNQCQIERLDSDIIVLTELFVIV